MPVELPNLGTRHALLLQGPAGPFMRRFARDLIAEGIRVTKVNFHVGDTFFFPPRTPGVEVVAFRESFDEWKAWLERLMKERKIDGVFLFGDCRTLHREAVAVAESRDVKVWVFEEGYLRPDWVTLEEHGVNGRSRMPRDPDAFRDAVFPIGKSVPVGKSSGLRAWYSTLNALAFTLFNGGFPHYQHHRDLNAWKHTAWHVRGAYRKVRFRFEERGMLEHFTGRLSGRYFLVPLQVYCDFQLLHSPFENVGEMIHRVVETFERHADPDDHIVFKHHPMDRSYTEYGELFRELGQSHGLGERLHYCHDLHLPTLLRHAKGTITINSTAGLQSIHHKTPVITLGTAVYAMEGLTHQGTLEEFLATPGTVDLELYASFRAFLLQSNQCNGSFYRRLTDGSGAGIRWFPV